MRLSLLLVFASVALAQPLASPQAAPDTAFSDVAASHLLDQIRTGLEGHSQKKLLSAFDLSKMTGAASFRQQIASFFAHYEPVRIYFKQQKTFMEGTHGLVVVSIDMEATPPGDAAQPVRKSAEIHFSAENGPGGWKFTDMQPRSFFSTFSTSQP